MSRLYVNQTLERQIRQYCEINDIEDVNAFANRCLSQGFSIVKFGTSPKDNVERENKGIKDVKKASETKKKRPLQPSNKEEEVLIVDDGVKFHINNEYDIKYTNIGLGGLKSLDYVRSNEVYNIGILNGIYY